MKSLHFRCSSPLCLTERNPRHPKRSPRQGSASLRLVTACAAAGAAGCASPVNRRRGPCGRAGLGLAQAKPSPARLRRFFNEINAKMHAIRSGFRKAGRPGVRRPPRRPGQRGLDKPRLRLQAGPCSRPPAKNAHRDFPARPAKNAHWGVRPKKSGFPGRKIPISQTRTEAYATGFTILHRGTNMSTNWFVW